MVLQREATARPAYRHSSLEHAGAITPPHPAFRFTSRPQATAFLWDWTGLAAPIAGAGSTCINGEYLAWVRWTEAGLDAATDILEPVLGKPVGEVEQLRRVPLGAVAVTTAALAAAV